MREGWTYKKLGEVAKISSGKAIPSSDIIENYSEDLYPCYGGNGLRGYVDHYSHDGLIPVVGRVGALCGNVHLPQGKFYATEHALVVCLTTADEPHYMKYLLSFLNLRQYAKGVAQPVLSASTLSKISISLPSLSEQQSIVAELDKINELISLKKAQLSDLDSLAQSIFYDMFGDPIENEKGWEVKKFGEVGEVERGAGISKKDFVDEGLPCIHYGQLHTILGPITKKHYTSIPESLLPKYKIAHTGDLIMAITSEDVEGSCKSTAWLGDYEIVVGSDAAILHHDQNGTFLSYYTMTKAFYNEKAKYAKGFKVTHISTKEIESIPVYLPPLSLQQDFAKRIELIEQQKAQISSTIKDLETLLASRMQYWFD